MTPAVLEANGLTRAYGAVTALEDLTFDARPGEVIGLLGPNGAGKTTAIRVLTAVLAPSAGRFSVCGHTRPEEVRRHIGVLPESAGYPARQTGAELLRYLARLHGQTRASAAAVAGTLLAQVGLAEHARSPIGAYSRGMRQRLGIAGALVNEPAVVFFDEPTLGLDPAGQRDVLALLGGMASERGATVVLSTHFLAEVEEACSRVLILNRGRLVAAGTVSEVVARAAAPRRARCRVPAEERDRAAEMLGAVPEGRDWVVVTLAEGADAGPTLAALESAGIPLLAYELEGARLSDAFLTLTGGG